MAGAKQSPPPQKSSGVQAPAADAVTPGRAGAQGLEEAAPAVATTLSPSALLSSPAVTHVFPVDRTHASPVDRTRATSNPLPRNGAPAQISSSGRVHETAGFTSQS